MPTVEPLPAPDAFLPLPKIGHWSILPRNEFFSIVPLSGSDVDYIVARTSQGLFQSSKHGIFWSPIPPPQLVHGGSVLSMRSYRLAAGPDEHGPLYLLLQNHLYVGDIAGNWTKLPVPLQQLLNARYVMLAASRKTKGKLYVAGGRSKGEIVLSSTSDGGHTWDKPRPVWNLKSVKSDKFALAPHPLLLDGDETVFMAAVEGVYRCGDEIVRLSHHAVLDAMAVCTVSPQIATAGSLADDGGYHLQISKNRGATWSTRDPYPYRFVVKDLLFAEELLFARVGRWDPASGGRFARVDPDDEQRRRQLDRRDVAAVCGGTRRRRRQGMAPQAAG